MKRGSVEDVVIIVTGVHGELVTTRACEANILGDTAYGTCCCGSCISNLYEFTLLLVSLLQ